MPTVKRLSPAPVSGSPAIRTLVRDASVESCRLALRESGPGVYCYQEGVGAAATTRYFQYFALGVAPKVFTCEAEAEAEVNLARTAVEAAVATAALPPAPWATTATNAYETAQQVLAKNGHDFAPVRRRLFAEVEAIPTMPPVPPATVGTRNDYRSEPFLNQVPVPVPTHVRIVRDDTAAHLSVMGSEYTPVAARLWFSVLDPQAASGRIRYSTSRLWDAVQTLHFRLPHESIPGLFIGGVMATSHDGSTALRATATVEVYGRMIYSQGTWSTRHTRFVAARVGGLAKSIMETVVSESEALIVACANAQHVDAGSAADAIFALPDFAAIVERRAKIEATDDDKAAGDKRAKAMAEARVQLAGIAANFPTYLGGLRFVIAAGEFGARGEVSDYSWHNGVARERATQALVRLAAVGATLRVAIGEDAVQTLNDMPDDARKGHVEAAKRRLMERLGEFDRVA
jgi:hypothetical protein